MTSYYTTAISYLREVLYPRRCSGCFVRGEHLCERCLNGIRASALAPILINNPFDRSVFNYQHPAVKRLVWKLKYKKVEGVSTLMAKLIYERLVEELADWLALEATGGQLILIPTPATKKRKHERRFNQAESIAHKLAALDPKHLVVRADLLTKTRETLPQASLGRKERLKNLVGAFEIKDGKDLAGRTVAVIDDVITTGATITEARRALKKAGAARVYALSFAQG